MAKIVSKTYGEALFELASEQGRLKELMEEVNALCKILDENPEFDKLMKHPGVSKPEKISVMENAFKGNISDELTGFLSIVIAKERYGQLRAIFEYFSSKVKEVEKIGVVYVSTATELSEAYKESVVKKILETTDYKTLEMHYDVDASIIGGMIIRIGDRVVDSSIRSKLEDLTKQLMQIQLG